MIHGNRWDVMVSAKVTNLDRCVEEKFRHLETPSPESLKR